MTLPSESNSRKIKIKTMKEFRIEHRPSSLFYWGVHLNLCCCFHLFEEKSWVCFQKRGTRFNLEISILKWNKMEFFTLAGCDIFIELRNILVLLSAKHQTVICIASAWKKGYAKDQMPAAEESLGRTPVLLAEGHRVPDRMLTILGSTWNPVLQLPSSNLKVAALLQTVASDDPRRLPELLIANRILWLAFSVSLYKYDNVKQLLKCKSPILFSLSWRQECYLSLSS